MNVRWKTVWPSLERDLNNIEEVRQVSEDEDRNIPRVAKLSAECIGTNNGLEMKMGTNNTMEMGTNNITKRVGTNNVMEMETCTNKVMEIGTNNITKEELCVGTNIVMKKYVCTNNMMEIGTNNTNMGEEKHQFPSDEIREFPRVAQQSSMRKVGEVQSYLPGPGESPRVAQLSSMCKVREGQPHLPGPSLTKCLRQEQKNNKSGMKQKEKPQEWQS